MGAPIPAGGVKYTSVNSPDWAKHIQAAALKAETLISEMRAFGAGESLPSRLCG